VPNTKIELQPQAVGQSEWLHSHFSTGKATTPKGLSDSMTCFLSSAVFKSRELVAQFPSSSDVGILSENIVFVKKKSLKNKIKICLKLPRYIGNINII